MTALRIILTYENESAIPIHMAVVDTIAHDWHDCHLDRDGYWIELYDQNDQRLCCRVLAGFNQTHIEVHHPVEGAGWISRDPLGAVSPLLPYDIPASYARIIHTSWDGMNWQEREVLRFNIAV